MNQKGDFQSNHVTMGYPHRSDPFTNTSPISRHVNSHSHLDAISISFRTLDKTRPVLMVYIPPPSLAGERSSYMEAYHEILKCHRRAPLASASSVNILVSPNVDSLCAARMLAMLFKQDDIGYRIVPVSGPDELQSLAGELKKNPDLHTLILINMGANFDLSQNEWFGGFENKVKVHVIDSNRPLDLNNLFLGGENGSRIVIWDDGDAEKLVDEKKSWEFTTYNPDPEDLEGDLENNIDNDKESGEEAEDDDGFSEDNEGGSQSETNFLSKKRKKTSRNNGDEQMSSITPEEFQFHQDRLRKYYEHGASYGQSAASTMYILTMLLERVDNNFLWLAIMGLTYQYITFRLSRKTYDMYYAIYLDEVSRLNPHANTGTNSNSPMNSDDTTVRTSDELRFMLFRHWNLYDAMFHSSYVASKLGIWKARGQQRLAGLLAKMGFSIPQTQQSYSHMDMDLKRSLIDKLNSNAPEYGLVELFYPSFTRSYGFLTLPLSAADAVEGICALLDVGGARMEIENEGMRNGGEWFGGGRTWEGVRPEKTVEKSETNSLSAKLTDHSQNGLGENGTAMEGEGLVKQLPWWIKSFWTAYDALSGIRSLKASLSLAMSLQRAVVRQGASIIEKQAIRTMRNHHVVILTQGPDLHLFCNPGMLSRLALWLVDALRDKLPGMLAGTRTSSKTRSLPLVLGCLDENRARYILIGVMGALEFDQIRKNQFSFAFLNALDATHTIGEYGGFDTNIISLAKKDLNNFLQGLCR